MATPIAPVASHSARTAAQSALSAARHLAHQNLAHPLPAREAIITTPEYWQTEAAAYRTWRLQLDPTPMLIPKEAATDPVAEAALELEAASKTAEQLVTKVPGREVLVDDVLYWEIEEAAWVGWAEGVRMVLEGEEREEREERGKGGEA